MSAVERARFIDGAYICARCTASLARPIPPGQSDRPGILVDDVWRLAAADPREPTLTILMLSDRTRARARTTAMASRSRRPRRTDARGRIPAPEVYGYPLPVLMPCRRPGCGQANRVDL
jgi:hypothetical protein